ncbi:HNH endonuclease [Saccharomonospora saliphila]|uniref:HNH endonuclease n=1 Tax=Saccharomonospora saliphila TaxID=369829 RepID=UPI00037B20F0|nr:HNH endonuclease signature motif containing protein [Saccharomonospora saliphila]
MSELGERSDDVPEGSVLDRVREWGACLARLEAAQLRDIAEYHRRRGGAPDVAAELALALALSENQARRKLDLALTLTDRLPHTLAAMEAGQLGADKAAKVAEPTACLSDEHAREVDAALAGRLAGREPGWIRRAVTRLVARVDPGGASERARRRRAERRVELVHGHDGMATLFADLPAEVATAAYTRIDRRARALRGRGEQRTTDQLRADVLADLLLGTTAATDVTGGAAWPAAARAEVFVYVDLPTLAGIAERPGELAGHGPVPARVAREIAFGPRSTWRRIVTDPLTGAPVDVGRRRYRPPAVTDEYVRVRDRHCRFPGCHRPSQFGDLDHVTEWGRGRRGRTDTENLIGLCRRHHRLKDAPGWTFHLDRATHRFTVRGPSGQTHGTDPEPLHPPRSAGGADPPPF